MSKKKELRQARREARQAAEGKRIVAWVAGALIILFVILFAAYAFIK